MRTIAFSLLAAAVMALPASAQTLERIKENNQINIGFRADAAPLSFAQSDGQPAGYTPLICVGVAQAISKSLDLPDLNISFQAVDTKNRFEKVARGEIDLLCGAASITLERRKLVDFSVPVFVDGTAVLLPKGAVLDLAALTGKNVGVRSNTTTEKTLAASLTQIGVDAKTISFANHNAGVAAVANGEIDAYFADQSILMHKYFSENLGNTLQFPEQLLTLEKQGLALARGDADFRLMVDAALSEMFANGAMEKIFGEAFPGVQPGQAVQAMWLMSPTMP